MNCNGTGICKHLQWTEILLMALFLAHKAQFTIQTYSSQYPALSQEGQLDLDQRSSFLVYSLQEGKTELSLLQKILGSKCMPHHTLPSMLFSTISSLNTPDETTGTLCTLLQKQTKFQSCLKPSVHGAAGRRNLAEIKLWQWPAGNRSPSSHSQGISFLLQLQSHEVFILNATAILKPHHLENNSENKQTNTTEPIFSWAAPQLNSIQAWLASLICSWSRFGKLAGKHLQCSSGLQQASSPCVPSVHTTPCASVSPSAKMVADKPPWCTSGRQWKPQEQCTDKRHPFPHIMSSWHIQTSPKNVSESAATNSVTGPDLLC